MYSYQKNQENELFYYMIMKKNTQLLKVKKFYFIAEGK
jgi:hypothetical protein